ncbi:hypothetical protein LguiB_021201 [Lonicera macranthoides]
MSGINFKSTKPATIAQAKTASTVESQAVDEPRASRFTWTIDNFSRLTTKKLYSDEGRESDDYGRSKYSQREDESWTVKAWEGEKVHKVAVDLELTFRSEKAHESNIQLLGAEEKEAFKVSNQFFFFRAAIT